ncbi:MAG: class I SAM-dependent methyltransferase [Acidobacteriota bacterium]
MKDANPAGKAGRLDDREPSLSESTGPGTREEAQEPTIGLFVGEPTRDLSHWAWLWTADREFPLASHRRGLIGWLVTRVKRFLRPIVKFPLNDLWDRQRTYNLILLETVTRQASEFQSALEAHARLLEKLDHRTTVGLNDVMRHNDALFARVDQKLDRYRRETKDLWHRLGAFISNVEAGVPQSLAHIQEEQGYVELEKRHRGSEEEITERISTYLPYLKGQGEVLDLGCGRGEALRLFASHGLKVRGVDSSSEMVARCLEDGMTAEQGDLFEVLARVEEGSLGGVVSFHVVEHLASDSLERLVRLAWRALRPGGVLILETPSPLSVVMSARNFWVDPTHRRPVHPASLELSFREAGFEPVHRIDLHPFPDDERLPEIDISRLPEEQRVLADQVNRLRDILDDLLFGNRDFGLVGIKP